MKTTIKIFLFLSIALLIISGCTTELTSKEIPIREMSNTELREQIIQANSELNKFDVHMSTISTMRMDFFGADFATDSKMESTMAIDRVKKEATLDAKVSTKVLQGGEESTNETNIRLVIKDGYITEERDGVEVKKTKLADGDWNKIDYLGSSLAPLSASGELEILDDEEIDGKDYYVIEMRPSAEGLLEAAGVQLSEGTEGLTLADGETIEEIYIKLWLEKSTLHIRKSKAYMKVDSESISWLLDTEFEISNVS